MTLLLAITPIMLLFVTSCNRDQVTQPDENKGVLQDYLTVSDFDYWGELHNGAMDNVEDNFVVDTTIVVLEELVDTVRNFNCDYLSDAMSDSALQFEITGMCHKNKWYVVGDSLGQEFDAFAAGDILEYLFNNGVIDGVEHDLLERLVNLAQSGLDSSITMVQMEDSLRLYELIWNNQQYTEWGDGYVSGVVLNIALHSVDFWTMYPPPIGKSNSICLPVLGVIAAKDLAGAILSAVSTAAIQYAAFGKVNVKVVAMATAVGAVSASTGCLQILYTAIVRVLGNMYP